MDLQKKKLKDGVAMSELVKNSDTFVLFNSHYQVYLAIGTGTLMIEENLVHTTTSLETARTFSIYAQAREFMNLLNEYHDKEFEAWEVINSGYIDFFCKVAEPQHQLTIPKRIADELDNIPNEAKEYVRVNDFGEYSVLDDFVELREFYESDEDEILPKFMELKDFVKDNLNLCVIYLAGKALGVDLVKVGDDDRQTNIAGQ